MKRCFRINTDFVNRYRELSPPFGFNGLGEIVYRRSYSRLQNEGKYENWAETVERVVNGTFGLWEAHSSVDPETLQKNAQVMYDKIFNFKFTPPGRGLWAMGSKITESKGLYAALNNCAFVSTQDLTFETAYKPFTFLMDASMLGVGVGFDTKGAGKVNVQKTQGSFQFKVEDTREGWVKSLQVLLQAYFEGGPVPEFDYSQIRPAGHILRTFGGVSSGPGPLIELHSLVSSVLQKREGLPLTSRDIVDLMNLIGKCVVSGNIRRTAEIAFGEPHDYEFLELKDYNKHPERIEYGWSSNNSVLAEVGMDYRKIAECIAKNGEPGLAWLENMQKYSRMCEEPNFKDSKALGGNPCLEQTLESYELCCLVEVFINNHESFEEFKDTLKYAFMYAKAVTLGPTHWKETREVMSRNRRIGCSLTGIAQFLGRNSLETLKEWCEGGYSFLKGFDQEVSQQLGIPQSIKITSVKPSGTVSLLAGATPGLHFPHSHFYIRRVRVPNTDQTLLSKLRAQNYPIEPDVYSPNTSVVSVPVSVDPGVKVASQVSMWEQLDLAAFMQKYWADNQVSCTVSFDPQEESQLLVPALEHFQHKLKGVSFLPHTPLIPYPQMPYESITEDKYQEMMSQITVSSGLKATQTEVERPSFPDVFCDNCGDEEL